MNEQVLMAMVDEMRKAAIAVFGPDDFLTTSLTVKHDELYAYVGATRNHRDCVIGRGATAREAVDDAIRQLSETPPRYYTPEQIAATLGCEVAP